MPIIIGSQTRKVTAKSTQMTVFSCDRKVSSDYSSVLAILLQLADSRLSATQKLVLTLVNGLFKYHNLTVTALADEVSRKSSVPYSTVKWNLRALKDMGLLKCGDIYHKGESACLTLEAQMLADHFERNL